MSGRDVPAISASLTINGGADGTATLASVVGFYAGQKGYISGATAAAKPFQILAVDTNAKTLKLKLLSEPTQAFRQVVGGVELQPSAPGLSTPNYGGSDLSGFTLADSAKVVCDTQFVYGA